MPLNCLGRRPGDYLATEFDVGLQRRFKPWSIASVETTFEGGLLIPGNAFAQSPGGTMGPVWLAGLRLTLSSRSRATTVAPPDRAAACYKPRPGRETMTKDSDD
jgi:hypothetical protein